MRLPGYSQPLANQETHHLIQGIHVWLKDDPVLGAALAGQARAIVTRDRDLLDLGKPFGIKMLRTGDFLRELNR